MNSNSEDQDQRNLLTDKEEQEETYLDLRLFGRTNKMDLKSFIIGKEYKREVIKVHFEDNVSNTTKKHAKEAILIILLHNYDMITCIPADAWA